MYNNVFKMSNNLFQVPSIYPIIAVQKMIPPIKSGIPTQPGAHILRHKNLDLKFCHKTQTVIVGYILLHQTKAECTEMGLMRLCLSVCKWVLEPDGDKETRSVDTDLNGTHSDRAKKQSVYRDVQTLRL